MHTPTDERQPEGLWIFQGLREGGEEISGEGIRREQVNISDVMKANQPFTSTETSGALTAFVSRLYANIPSARIQERTKILH